MKVKSTVNKLISPSESDMQLFSSIMALPILKSDLTSNKIKDTAVS